MPKLKNVVELHDLRAFASESLSRQHKQVLVCAGTGCVAGGSLKIFANIKKRCEELGLDVCVELKHEPHEGDEKSIGLKKSGCHGFCEMGPLLKIEPLGVLYTKVKLEDCEEIVERTIMNDEVIDRLLYQFEGRSFMQQEEIPFYKRQTRHVLENCGRSDAEDILEYIAKGGYEAFVKAIFSMEPQEVCQMILDSGLRGRGGGGFPTGRKWALCAPNKAPQKYVVCNADEGDPGAFMDRSILEGNPLAVIEGMMIAGYAIGAQNGYFYVRAEYPIAVNRLKIAIKQAESLGLIGDNILGTGFSFRVHIRLGAGAFVCGEETALLNSIEGQRGMPRPRPPFPAVKGLWQCPTIVNNVETLACVPYIMREGVAAFTRHGTEKSKGTKVFALGGKINNVGLVEVPMGTTLRELIYDIGGGIPHGKKFKAIQTGGPSGGCLTEADLDAEIDFDNLVAKGSMMGSGGAIVMDEDNCMVDVAKFYMEFIYDESCGKCSPCRIGTKRMLELLTKIVNGKATMDDLDALEKLAANVRSNSLCALGQTAPNPILSTLAHFRDEYVAHIVDKRCPAHVCKNLMVYSIDPEKCRKCSLCSKKCPVDAIHGVVGKEPYVIDTKKCIKCGMCMASCKFGAVEKK